MYFFFSRVEFTDFGFLITRVIEPLRRGDLLNAINKLASERGGTGGLKGHFLLRRAAAAVTNLPHYT